MLHNSCEDEPALAVCKDQAQHESGFPALPLDLIEPRDHHRGRAPSVPIDDLMIPPAHRQGHPATLAAEICPANLHAYMSRRGESFFAARQPKIASGTAGDHALQRAAAVAWPSRCYSCSFCGREFNSAQALGGHMNIHRRDRARLRSTISHQSSNSPHHDLPPAASTDQITAQSLQPLPLSTTTQLYLPFHHQAANFGEYCEGLTPSSISQNTYTTSPMIHASGSSPPFKVGASSPSDDHHRPFDYNSYSTQISNPIPLHRFGSSTHSSAATPDFSKRKITDSHSSLIQKASPLIRNPRLKSKPVAAPNCGPKQEDRSSQFRLGVAGRSNRASADEYGVTLRASASDQYGTAHAVRQFTKFKEAEVQNKRRSFADTDAASSEDRLIAGSIQWPRQHYNERPSSGFVTRDSDSVHGIAAVPAAYSEADDLTTPASNDSGLASLDLELRLGRRSSLSPGNLKQPPAQRRPP